jgi:hypothetical protein
LIHANDSRRNAKGRLGRAGHAAPHRRRA